MLARSTLERHQVWLYLVSIGLGLLLGSLLPAFAQWASSLIWPVLMLLLYSAFIQVPLLHLRAALMDQRFLLSLLLGNFLLIPLLLWVVLPWLPADPAIRLGILLVLLVPCTDWFITFVQLGKGDTSRAITATPVNLLLQIMLLPVYLWLMLGNEISVAIGPAQVWPTLLVVLLPLGLATLSERWVEARPQRKALPDHLAWYPVPLLALVLLMVACSQVTAVAGNLGLLLTVVPWFIGFLVFAALLAKTLAIWLRLPDTQGRTLAFSMGTRNSFVVLPLALSLPAGWELAALVIVLQSLVELFGMLFYLWWLPRLRLGTDQNL
ncbi:MAG: arsenic resistance protein [Gammaproteobacteria bacterium]|nr:arsenic resistance protein [Gammaproteobacteria bacterium]